MSLTPILQQADIFEDLTPTQLELIASICTTQHYDLGEVIFAENTASLELYVVAGGMVEIQVNPAILGKIAPLAGSETVAIFRRGQSFGEVALLDEGLRSATARCVQGGAELIVIPRDRLMFLCDAYPELGYRLMKNLATDLALKIRGADLKIREQLLWTPMSEQ